MWMWDVDVDAGSMRDVVSLIGLNAGLLQLQATQNQMIPQGGVLVHLYPRLLTVSSSIHCVFECIYAAKRFDRCPTCRSEFAKIGRVWAIRTLKHHDTVQGGLCMRLDPEEPNKQVWADVPGRMGSSGYGLLSCSPFA